MTSGVYVRTEETRKKMSERNIGKTLSKEHREKISNSLKGERNPNFGKILSDETKRKIGKANFGREVSEETRKKISKIQKGRIKSEAERKNISKGQLRKKIPEETREKIRKKLTGGKASKETREKLSEMRSGEKHPGWKGGASFIPYCVKFDEKRRRAVREFFSNLCICTGEPSYIRKLSVHHIYHDKNEGCNGRPFNLVPICIEHHSKELHNEEEYAIYINKTLREGFKWGIWNEEEYMEKVMY